MSTRYPDDAVLPPSGRDLDADAFQVRLITIMPILIALAGVGFILFGGLGAGTPVAVAGKAETDPMTTGSVAKPPKDIRQILEMLDR